MKAKRSLMSLFALFSLVTLLASAGTSWAHDGQDHNVSPAEPLPLETRQLISDVREATANFRDFDEVEEAGYGKFLDCFVNQDIGGMGQHYVNGDLVGDDVLDPMRPEALVYEPTEDGDMILVAYEYLVFADAWDYSAARGQAPVLFGQEFHLKTNIPNTPPVWALHIWLWTDNPHGMFSDFNPVVFCPTNQPVTDFTPAS
ncbi:MAG: hypothetical protein KJ065_19705 [Anaerolineae bacterium]|nr:hypothetical protein [Anaerolineae bacterium]